MTPKEKILKIGLDLFSAQAYHNTGVREITKAIEMPTGSFHYYFKNKEEFALEVLDFFFEKDIAEPFSAVIDDEKLNPKQKIIGCFSLRAKASLTSTIERGKLVSCIMGNLGQEIGGENRAIADKLQKLINDNIIFKMSALITEGQRDGSIQSKVDTSLLANILFNAFEGSLIQRKISRNDKPLKDFLKSLEYLL